MVPIAFSRGSGRGMEGREGRDGRYCLGSGIEGNCGLFGNLE